MDLVLVHAVPKEYCTATSFTKALNAAHQITPSPCFETGVVISPTCFLHTRKIARQRIHSELILLAQSASLIHHLLTILTLPILNARKTPRATPPITHRF